ncbi:MAG: relaxase/mobilization nuclease domain-containing protein [Acidobacteria bacterium]|nr:relaxase/mobilization nuclease domain-containing protein [Acidobacteriota bacterium]
MIALAATGGGFGGLVAYITHDAPTEDLRQPESSERVSWTHTENLPTDEPALAARIMAGVVQDAPILKQRAGVSARGRKLKDPCLHLTLSWSPKENPTPKEMISATREALKSLGLDGHQAVLAAHHDRDHRHVHAAVNRVSTEDGRAVNLRQSGRRLSAWAEQYERTHGGIQVPARVERRQAVVERKKRPPMQRRVGPGRVHRLPAERRQWNRHYQRQRDNPREPALERRDRVRLSRRHRRLRPARTAVAAVAAGRTAVRTALARTRSAGSVVTWGTQSAITQFGRAAVAGTRAAVRVVARGTRSAGSAIARTALGRSVLDAMAMPRRDREARAREDATAARRAGVSVVDEPRGVSDPLEALKQHHKEAREQLHRRRDFMSDREFAHEKWLLENRFEDVSRRLKDIRDGRWVATPPSPPKSQAPATEPTKAEERPRPVKPAAEPSPAVSHERREEWVTDRLPWESEDRPRSSSAATTVAPEREQPSRPSVVEPSPAVSSEQPIPAARLGQRRPVEPARPGASAAPAPSESRVEQLLRERKRIDQLFKDARGARRQFEMEDEARAARTELEREIRKLPAAERRELRDLERKLDRNHGMSR